jgi:hypothetical protein
MKELIKKLKAPNSKGQKTNKISINKKLNQSNCLEIFKFDYLDIII